MNLTRRNFLKVAGTSTALVAGQFGFNLTEASAEAVKLRTREAKEYPSICCFCSGGCGVLAQVVNGTLVGVEGDPDNPVNRGANCSKGASVFQTSVNDQRITSVLYRAPGSETWEVRTWDWAINRIAKLTKETRDKDFELIDSKGAMVSRNGNIASLGSSILNNEDLYLIVKFMRGLGVTYIEHQARI